MVFSDSDVIIQVGILESELYDIRHHELKHSGRRRSGSYAQEFSIMDLDKELPVSYLVIPEKLELDVGDYIRAYVDLGKTVRQGFKYNSRIRKFDEVEMPFRVERIDESKELMSIEYCIYSNRDLNERFPYLKFDKDE